MVAFAGCAKSRNCCSRSVAATSAKMKTILICCDGTNVHCRLRQITLCYIEPAKAKRVIYLVISYDIHNAETFKNYPPAVAKLFMKYSAEILAMETNPKTLEASPKP